MGTSGVSVQWMSEQQADGNSAHSREIGGVRPGFPVALLRRAKRRAARLRDRLAGSRDGEVSFFVLGAGRGGTSLFATLLDTHPGLELGFEFECADSLLGEDLPRKAGDVTLLDDRLDAFVSRCRWRAGRHPSQRWGNKLTTEHLRALEDHNLRNPGADRDVLEAFLVRFPATRFLFVLRDGRACVRSKLQRTGQTLEDACERWRYSVAVMRSLERSSGDRLHVVRFEDLVRDPEQVLDGVARFLGVESCFDLAAGARSKGMRADYRRDSVEAGAAELGDVPEGVEERIAADLIDLGYLTSTNGG